jgi:hypothetical protein
MTGKKFDCDMPLYRKQVKLVFWLFFFTAARYTYQARAVLVIGAQLRLAHPFVHAPSAILRPKNRKAFLSSSVRSEGTSSFLHIIPT